MKTHLAALVLLASCSVTVFAAPASTMPAAPATRPAPVEDPAWTRACEAFRISEIKRLMAKGKSEREWIGHLPPEQVQSGRAELQATMKLLAGYRNKTIKATPPFKGQIDIGSMGRAPNIRVITIEGRREAIVHLEDSTTATLDSRGEVGMLYDGNFDPQEVLLRGVDTSRWVDDRVYPANLVLKITGTASTDAGTMLVAEPMP